MGVREQICMSDSVKVKVNLILICCMCERVCVYAFVSVCGVGLLAELRLAQMRGNVSR